MIEFIAENLAPIMFVSLIVFLLLGYPVAFSLAANGLLFFIIGVELAPLSDSINLSWPLLNALPDRFWGVMSNDTLLAIPFFTFMGIVLEKSGMAEDLLDTIGQLFGPIRGGLAYAVIFVGALLAATTGVVAASVIAMGLISLPIMLRYGYDRRVASGVIAASGTLAQIIPPSLVLIVLADQLGRSVGDMYAGALIPGLVLTGLYMIYILIMTFVRRDSMPALPLAARTLGSGVTSLIVALIVAGAFAYAAHIYLYPTHGENADILGATVGVGFIYVVALLDRGLKINAMSRLAQQVIIVLIPPLALIFLVLGTIFLGIATPTEGGAMGAVGALIMAAAKGRLSMDVVRSALAATTRLSAFVLFILIGARVFSLTFYGVNGHIWVEHLLTAMPGGETGFLITVNLLVFFLAFFLDFFELAFIIVPLLGSGRRQARHRPDLVRRAARHQHADQLHASAVRLRALLSALGRGQGALSRQGHRKDDTTGDDRADLLGGCALRRHPDHHGGADDHVPADGHALQGKRRSHRSEHHQDRGARIRDRWRRAYAPRQRRRPRPSRRSPASGRQPARPEAGGPERRGWRTTADGAVKRPEPAAFVQVTFGLCRQRAAP